ncbi:VanZ family protein [Verrucomicrobium sp. 3C]|uniref:VanZ family protein n=1 Tax=Verrucomicrobium sp. 3C TaxID=1134055 RepID=UPI000374EBD4|nr:VanZ family protein [Verrucomicrobium sp. 3C]
MSLPAPPKPKPSDRRLLRWIAFLAYALLLLSLSSIPGPNLPQELGRVNDKLLHGAAYSGAGLLARLATGSMLGATAAVAILGAVDENYQRLIPGRTPDPRDWAADLVGGFSGALLTALVERCRNRKRARRDQTGEPTPTR